MTIWYVSPGRGGNGWAAGSDANDGLSKQTPFLTVQFAVGCAQSGDTVVVGPGDYRVAEGFEEAVERAKQMKIRFIIL